MREAWITSWRMSTIQKARKTYQIENRVCFSMAAFFIGPKPPVQGSVPGARPLEQPAHAG
jgi:hypothetical protein